MEACCTCAKVIGTDSSQHEISEKSWRYMARRTSCCARAICTRCVIENPRFDSYCPFCQVSEAPSIVPQGLREPPAYSPPSSPQLQSFEKPLSHDSEQPPAYEEDGMSGANPEKSPATAPDVLHFVDVSYDTIHSLSLRYGVPADSLRRLNNLYSDHLIQARRTILIPGEFYKGGVSLSPRPVEGEEEEIRKTKIRKWMVTCKVSEYEVALLYLKQADFNLDEAIETYREDEKWEKEHPLDANKGKNIARESRIKKFGSGLSGQLL